MNVRFEHEIAISEDRFWKLAFDEKFNTELHRNVLGMADWQLLEQNADDQTIRRRVTAIPKLEMPAIVAKALGSSLRYTESSTFDKKTKVWRWSMTPSVFAEKTRVDGTVRTEKLGDSRVRRIIEVDIEVKVFGIGGAVASTYEKGIRDAWGKGTPFWESYKDA